MDFRELKHIYFLGIGGIGMSALARYFNSLKIPVSGYDRHNSELTKKLISEGIEVHFNDDVKEIPEVIKDKNSKTLIIYTPAIPKEQVEISFFREHNYPLNKRAEVLGLISKQGNCIAVAGTHGKTTTSSIIAYLLDKTIGCNAFIGGITTNFNSNLILNSESNNYVVEADEFDRSFLVLNPNIGIITSMDADHLDIYGKEEELVHSFELFAEKVEEDGLVIIKKEISSKIQLVRKNKTYSIVDSDADYFGNNIQVRDGKYYFDLEYKGNKVENLVLGLGGRHNVENAVAGLACCLELGVDALELKNALAGYSGVKRRFEYIYQSDKITYIDDYAHHPKELSAAINSAKELFPNKKITGVFQPHLFSRTYDFADEFADSLGLLDEIILLPIYPAREKPIPGVDSQLILDKIHKESKKLVEKNVLLYELKSMLPEVLLTLGAGDIDELVIPIREMISK